MRPLLILIGALGAAGVTIGAYQAHGLEAALKQQGLAPEQIVERLEQCQVAVHYHMLHTLALLVLSCSGALMTSRRGRLAVFFFLMGIALFSGGLYSMVFLGRMGHWAIVPGGGMSFIVGWLCVAACGGWSLRTGDRDEINDSSH